MKLGVCVPYRDRKEHLDQFIPAVSSHLDKQGIDHAFYICHQVDDKLFNRGATKNIAAKHAFEDGCDYIVWHDVDMLPEEGVDYSPGEKGPIHLATRISQMEYKLKYHEYFGGAVVFTKDQVESTNGYSNNYWDWGMEDDDLFWRCHLEGLTDDQYLDARLNTHKFARMSGSGSFFYFMDDRRISNITARNYTISVLVRPFQQPDKQEIYLFGDENRKFVEYPILRTENGAVNLSFNNSRAISFGFNTEPNQHHYMWAKRYDQEWTWATATVDRFNGVARLYINGEEVDHADGLGSESPLLFNGRLVGSRRGFWSSGVDFNLPEDHPIRYFKGDVARVYMWRRDLQAKEVARLHKRIPQDRLALSLEFGKGISHDIVIKDVETGLEDIKIPKSILPFRREGRFTCLPHVDEGLVDGKWAKGETTARNERKYVLETRQGRANYKEDGISTLEYELVGVEKIAPNAKMINVRL